MGAASNFLRKEKLTLKYCKLDIFGRSLEEVLVCVSVSHASTRWYSVSFNEHMSIDQNRPST